MLEENQVNLNQVNLNREKNMISALRPLTRPLATTLASHSSKSGFLQINRPRARLFFSSGGGIDQEAMAISCVGLSLFYFFCLSISLEKENTSLKNRVRELENKENKREIDK